MCKKILHIVVSCYNEREMIDTTIEQLSKVMNSLISCEKVAGDSKIMIVDDGSSDGTWDRVVELRRENSLVAGVRLAANAGQQNALLAGLEHSSNIADAVISIDADLQDDIDVIPDMVDRFNEGYEIVYGVRNDRTTDSWFKRNSAQAFYRFMNSLGAKTIYNHSEFRLMSKNAIEKLLTYQERNLFLRGILPTMGMKTTTVSYQRKPRAKGESKYSVFSLMNLAMQGIVSFSVKPLRLLITLGVVFIVISLLILVYALYSFFAGIAVSGWTSIILSMWFIGGCVLFGLGIVGEYIGKIYVEVKHRPRYFIAETID